MTLYSASIDPDDIRLFSFVNSPAKLRALYQGYGTHYVDLWVGTPPQRQTVIIDTGSSVTAFPCSGCDHCGSNPATGEQYHLDDDFDTSASSTYREKACDPSVRAPCDLGMCLAHSHNGQAMGHHCQVTVSYAEGSSWTAVEGVDVVYPAGPHEEALETREEMLEAGVGTGMGDMNQGNDFSWMDFRLKFGCQSKVSDGILNSSYSSPFHGCSTILASRR